MQTHLLWQLKRPGYFPAVMAGIYDILRLLCENSAMVDIPPHFMKAVSYMNAHFTDPDVTIDRSAGRPELVPPPFGRISGGIIARAPLNT